MAKHPNKPTRKKKLGSYPHAMVIFTITLALFVIGLFSTLLIHASKLSDVVKQSIEVQVYLDFDLTQTQLTRLKNTFSQKEYIAYLNQIPQVRFFSKEEGAKEFIQESGEDFMAFLGDNPLRDAYIININPDFADSEHLKKIKAELEEIDGVYEVQYVASLIDSINQNLKKISIILLSFAGILVLVVVILINNTIKLAMFSQRFLIRSMQLVGATAGFIQRPFMNRAVLQGFISGLLASGMLFGLLSYAYYQINELYLLRDETQLIILAVLLVILGMVIGFISSFRAVRKYMHLSLDELY
ncbi:cell division protein FtsX [Adhaeribacter radiodurans]|uniref:Cell division protein FtsX n=1 Tax=Adhaeribacter radiodurans TaxID=2745197 RepID=A0A7L7L5K3_9BACT|nr:permease-like cell division protein FtsX [Adhaeribacter radiodurans]QMU27885.1 ABC transporter permease [Adhaeribacter radiodurans]